MSLPPEDLSTVEDFLNNEGFRTWVLERRPEDRLYWHEWLALHPDKTDVYEEAVAVFMAIQGKPIVITDEQVKGKTQRILNQIPDTYAVIRPLVNWQWGRWVAAAVLAGLLVWWQVESTRAPLLATAPMENQKPLPADGWKLVANTTEQPLLVFLPDNSSVLLSSNSQMRFRTGANHLFREVFLQGDAFFEVTKNPAKPFIVYTANLTTKVLGTSFQVHSFNKETTAFVKVKTGEVTVTPVDSPNKPVSLTVNQELRIKPGSEKTARREPVSPAEATSEIVTRQFVFNYTPIPDVLDQLTASYHMPIQYDRALLNNCTFTGQLDDMPYLEKIRLVCLAIESTFEVIDNRIIIHSNGCR